MGVCGPSGHHDPVLVGLNYQPGAGQLRQLRSQRFNGFGARLPAGELLFFSKRRAVACTSGFPPAVSSRSLIPQVRELALALKWHDINFPPER